MPASHFVKEQLYMHEKICLNEALIQVLNYIFHVLNAREVLERRQSDALKITFTMGK